MNFKKNGKVFTSKFVGTGPSSYKKRIYRAAVSQRLRNTALSHVETLFTASFIHLHNISTASERIYVFRVIIRTIRKYFPPQQ